MLFATAELTSFFMRIFFQADLKIPYIFSKFQPQILLNALAKSITNDTVVKCNFINPLKRENHPSPRCFVVICMQLNNYLIGKHIACKELFIKKEDSRKLS